MVTGLSALDGSLYVEAGAVNPDSVSEQEVAGFARFASAEQLEQYLINDALERYADLFGQAGRGSWPIWDPFVLTPDIASTANEQGDHSDTNTQVAGVDEGDLIETDGEYIYTLSGDELVIFDARPAEVLHVVSRTEIDGVPFALYLSGDRLTVLSQPAFQPRMIIAFDGPDSSATGLTADSVDLDYFTPSPLPRPPSTLTVFDVSDPKAPALVQKTEIDANLKYSRVIGSSVYLVIRSSFILPGPERLWGAGDEYFVASSDGSELLNQSLVEPFEQDFVYETQEQYLERIEGQVLDLVLREFSSYGPDGELVESGLLSEATDAYYPLAADATNLISVVVFDMAGDEPGPISSAAVSLKYGSHVYASPEALYVLEQGRVFLGDSVPAPPETSILKFRFDEATQRVGLVARGVVPGHVFDQFYVDEHDGDLRITTTEHEVQVNVFVLRQNGEELTVIGRLEGLAAGERFRSARFLSDRVFLSTSGQTDSLLAVDLSDPTQPRLAGETNIPGFSNYLQPIDDRYLIGIGQTSDRQRIQISLFDVDDLEHPRRVDQFTIDGEAWLLSEAAQEHHAVGYYPEYQVLTIPVATTDRWRAGIWVFRIDTGDRADAGSYGGEIQLLSRIEHETSLRRTVRIDDRLYAISQDAVTVHEILNPQTRVGKVYYEATPLGRIDFVELKDVDLSTGQRWYRFTTKRQGILTADALFDEASGGDLQITLYDSDFNELATSIDDYPWSQSRLDWDTDSGTEYYLEVSGTARDVDLRLANLVRVSQEDSGRSLEVYGTRGNDTFEFDVYWQSHGGDPWNDGPFTEAFTQRQAITINGVRYDFARLVSRNVTIDGMGGSDTATIDITGMAPAPSKKGSIVAELYPGSGTIRHTGPIFGRAADGTPQTFAMELDSVASITVNGGDEAHLFDSYRDDRFVATPNYGGMSGPGFSNHVLDFDSVLAHATAGSDVAKFYDSPGDDLYVTTPTYAGLSGEGFERHALGFDAAHAYATAGGFDVAKMYDSPSDDHFYADPIQGVLYGDGFLKRAKFFEQVHAYATAGGHDTADLFDSPEDDLFFSNSIEAALWGAGFYNRAKRFEEVHAHGTYSGNDRAHLLDSPAADHVAAQADWARISSVDLSYVRQVTAFDHVRATSTTGRNTKEIEAVDFMLTMEGEWTDP